MFPLSGRPRREVVEQKDDTSKEARQEDDTPTPFPGGKALSSGLFYPLSRRRGAHEVAHPEECQLLKVACSGIAAECRLCYPVEGILVVPLQGILARQGHPRLHAGLDNLLQ